MHKSRNLAILSVVLLILVAIAGVQHLLKLNTPEHKQQQLQDRMAVTGAINRAIMRIQNTRKTWPSDLEAIRNEPELKELPGGSLDGMSLKLSEVKGDFAYYQLMYNDKPRTLKIRKFVPSQGTPTLGSVGHMG